MKKSTLLAFSLSLVFVSANSIASTFSELNVVSIAFNDGRQIIKQEELPEPIKKMLATDAYKGWVVKEAALITPAAPQATATQPASAQTAAKPANSTSAAMTKPATPPTATTAAPATAAPATAAPATAAPAAAATAPSSYYELTLSKDKETKIVKFQKDGTLAK